MKSKILLGAGLLLTFFIFILILLAGSCSSDNVLPQNELKNIIPSVQCEVENNDAISYDIALLTNDVNFDNDIENQQYTKIIINKQKDFKTLGTSFVLRSKEDSTFNISLYKNGEVLKNISLNIKAGAQENVNLTLSKAIGISQSDSFAITFEQDTKSNFAFDTFLFFFDKE